MKIDTSKRVKDIIAEVPASKAILEKFGIDHDRAGSQPLQFACRDAGISLDDVLYSIEQAAGGPAGAETKEWNEVSLAGLIGHIVEKHHAYCREELARLEQLLSTVVRLHGERHSELRRIQSLFMKMGNDLKQHLLKEEQTLFPMIARMEEARNRNAAIPRLPFGTIANPIRMMLLEHDTGDRELDEIRRLSSDYQLPADSDAAFRDLFQGLRDFDRDMKEHVFLENDRLFPRAVALEKGSTANSETH